MSKNSNYTHVVETLNANLSGTRCKELSELLRGLGFEVRDGKRGGHKLFFHDGISAFQSGSYNCGHGKNPVVNKVYIKKVLKILKQFEAELSKLQ
ncbi:MAG TPA: type II toxin-antitoxin system HicA family toxin [Gammaproteobacteria bacterium]|nr:type II toxin-antitoxin system HicA family toxin [Gammaproteobacteria bacterium]